MKKFLIGFGVFLILLGTGGIIIALVFFLNEYQKRSELTFQLIQVLSDQRSTLNEIETKETYKKREDYQKTDPAFTPSKPDIETQLESLTDQENERFYWKG